MNEPTTRTTSRPAAKRTASAKKPVATKNASTANSKKSVSPTQPAKEPKPPKVKKPKMVRDSFTIPKDEYAVLDELKQRCVKLAQPSKKSELLRAGIKALAAMSDKNLLTALQTVPPIKTGRPKKA